MKRDFLKTGLTLCLVATMGMQGYARKKDLPAEMLPYFSLPTTETAVPDGDGFIRRWLLLEPIDKTNEKLPGIVIEFKVINPRKENSLEETVEAALKQIEEKNYDAELINRGVDKENIHHYGFAFRGKEVLIDGR